MDLSRLAERLERTEALDAVVRPLREAVAARLPQGSTKDALHGVWLGHPLHPLLTDLPIGFWTSSWVLDIVGGRRSRKAADVLVGLGVVSAVPTVATGAADWSELFEPEQRAGAVHALANVAATGLYAASLVARLRGRRAKGVALGMAGAGAATIGGFLGGHLAYRRAAGVNANAYAADPDDWTAITLDEPLPATATDRLTLGNLDGTPVAATGTTAVADRCSHLGGPLHEGKVADGCVTCPWHGSTFRLDDGTVVHGPATAPQPAYELRRSATGTEARRRRP